MCNEKKEESMIEQATRRWVGEEEPERDGEDWPEK
jgi:hypothetical protein